MQRTRQVAQPLGHSEEGTVGALRTEAARITLGSSDLNGFGSVGKTRRAALMHRGLPEPRKVAENSAN